MDTERNKDEQEKVNNSIFTPETFGMLIVLFSALCFVCLVTDDLIFSSVGSGIRNFLLGVLGYYAYAQMLLCVYFGVTMVSGKSFNISKKLSLILSFTLVAVVILLHAITSSRFMTDATYGNYLASCFSAPKDGTATGGGIFAGLIVYWGLFLFKEVGFYIISAICVLISVVLMVRYFQTKEKMPARGDVDISKTTMDGETATEKNAEVIDTLNEDIFAGTGVAMVQPKKRNHLYIANGAEFEQHGKRDPKVNLSLNVAGKGLNVVTAGEVKPNNIANADMSTKLDYIRTPQPVDVNKTLQNYNAPTPAPKGESKISAEIAKNDVNSNKNIEELRGRRLIETDFSSSVVSTGNDYDNIFAKENMDNPYASLFKPKKEEPSETITPIETANTNEEVKPSGDAMSDYFNRILAQKSQQKPVVEPQIEEPVHNEESVDFNDVNDFAFEENLSNDDGETEDIFSFDEPAVEEVVPETFIEPEPVVDIVPTPVEEVSKPIEVETSRDVLSEVYGDEDVFVEQPIVKEKKRTVSREPRTENTVRQSKVTDYVRTQKPTLNPVETKPVEEKKEEPEKEPEPINRPYFVPPISYLIDHAKGVKAEEEDHDSKLQTIADTLNAFAIPATGVSYITGPSITRYELSIATGVPLKRVLNYERDLSGVLEVVDGVRILAPIPGKNLIGIECANKVRIPVSLREVLEKTMQKEPKKNALNFAVGKSLVGEVIEDNLAKGPHYLIAGSTGAGKSVCLNTMLISLIMRYSPEELRFILVDPKTVEFRAYEHLPHLVTDEIISGSEKVLAVLDWAYGEMERRYKVFHDCGKAVVDIDGYNNCVACETVQKMPRIVIVIDELADLMQTCKRDLEKKIAALTAKARSAGIHLVLATQRPSVDVITGVIKANLPARIAFKVMSQPDSITILGEGGADKLLGYGDMLYKNSTMPNYERYQGAFITPEETNKIVDYIIKHNKAYFNDDLAKFIENAVNPPAPEKGAPSMGLGSELDDTMFIQALQYVIDTGGASISSLQRRFRIGFSKAGNYIDRMAELGYVSGNEGSKARRVLITREEFEERYGQNN